MVIPQRLRTTGLLCLTVCSGWLNAASDDRPSPAPTSFEAACRQAVAERKPIAVEFSDSNAPATKILREQILAQPEVKKILAEKYVFISLEQEKNPGWRKRYLITQTPVLVVLNADGTEIARMSRRAQVQQYVEFLQAGAAGLSEIDVLKKKLQNGDTSFSIRLALADACMRNQRDTDALSGYRWCLDNLDQAQGNKYRKSSMVLIGGLSTLGARLPAAKAMLHELQGRLDARCDTDPNFDSFIVLFGCNKALKDPGRNLDAYRRIDLNSPLRRQLLASVFAALVEQRLYSDVVSSMDMESFVNAAYNSESMFEGGVSASGKEPESSEVEVVKHVVVERSVAAVEALLATGQMEKAKRISGRLLESDGSRLVRTRLLEAGQRSGSSDAADFGTWVNHFSP